MYSTASEPTPEWLPSDGHHTILTPEGYRLVSETLALIWTRPHLGIWRRAKKMAGLSISEEIALVAIIASQRHLMTYNSN